MTTVPKNTGGGGASVGGGGGEGGCIERQTSGVPGPHGRKEEWEPRNNLEVETEMRKFEA